MEKEKNNRGLVIILTCLLLISVGYIVYDKITNLKGNNTSNEIDTTMNENLYSVIDNSKDNDEGDTKDTTDTKETTDTQETNDNDDSQLQGDTDKIDKKILDDLYYLIGALPEDGEKLNASRHCLNVAVTNTTYLGNLTNAIDILSWFATTYNKYANYEQYKDAVYKTDDGMELSAYHCAACRTIEKTEVEKFRSLYYFGPDGDDTSLKFYNIQNYDNIYLVFSSLGSPIHCDYNVKHNITNVSVKKGTDAETIYLTDEQIVTRYDDVDTNNISQQTKQTINYAFYKTSNKDAYSLDHVFHRNKVS